MYPDLRHVILLSSYKAVFCLFFFFIKSHDIGLKHLKFHQIS